MSKGRKNRERNPICCATPYKHDSSISRDEEVALVRSMNEKKKTKKDENQVVRLEDPTPIIQHPLIHKLRINTVRPTIQLPCNYCTTIIWNEVCVNGHITINKWKDESATRTKEGCQPTDQLVEG